MKTTCKTPTHGYINCLKNFIPYDRVDLGNLPSSVVAHLVRIEPALNPNMSTHGFTCITIPSNINLNRDFTDAEQRKALRSDVEKWITQLDEKHREQMFGMKEFEIVRAVDTVYRGPHSQFCPIPLVHVDFYWEKTNDSRTPSRIVSIFQDKWGITSEILEHYTMEMRNLWINLTPTITNNGLALMDISSLNTDDLIPYTAIRREQNIHRHFIAASLEHDPDKHHWFTKYEMKRGEGYIFKTFHTPHCSFKYPDISDDERQSVEMRLIFLKKRK